jgi:uncharacterized SAM-binding protein YcdF (DUF218 family)
MGFNAMKQFWAGTLAGVLVALMACGLVIASLPRLMVVDRTPHPVDAIVVLSGSASRLGKGVELYEQQLAPRLILTASKNESWQPAARRLCPDCTLEKWGTIILGGSIDTRTDAQLTLEYCRENNLQTILVVTSPYHSRRSQFVFNDIFAGSGITASVVSTGDYGHLLAPDEAWWRDRTTLETVWLEFGKTLYWELTPFMDFRLKGTGAF